MEPHAAKAEPNVDPDADGAELSGLSVLLVTGRDARQFLQGQLSNDLRQLTPQQALFTGLLSPQGRCQSILTLIEREEGICALLPSDVVEVSLTRLRRFVLGFAIDVAAAPEWTSVALSERGAAQIGLPLPEARGASASAGGVTLLRWWGDDARFVALGPRALLPLPRARAGALDAAFQLADIRAGLPEIHAATSGLFVPQMLNLDLLNGLSYTKGCYVGQEVVARARRGNVPRRLQRFAASCPPPVAGARVARGADDAGEVVGAAACTEGCELLAVVDAGLPPSGLSLAGIAGSALTPLSVPYALQRS